MFQSRVRLAVIALIVVFPAFLAFANSRKASVRDAWPAVALTSVVLVGGVSIAARERRLLLVERRAFNGASQPGREATSSRLPSAVS